MPTTWREKQHGRPHFKGRSHRTSGLSACPVDSLLHFFVARLSIKKTLSSLNSLEPFVIHSGGVSHRLVCRTLEDPASSQLTSMMVECSKTHGRILWQHVSLIEQRIVRPGQEEAVRSPRLGGFDLGPCRDPKLDSRELKRLRGHGASGGKIRT